MIEQMNRSLRFLRDKYGFADGVIAAGADFFLLETAGKQIELLPHRVERRFVELKKMIDGKTLEDVSTFRFAKYTPGGDLRKTLAEQLDLAEFLAGSAITRIFACGDGKKVCNCIIRFADGKSGSIECGTGLPAGAKVQDRHEIIARRGVGCDRGVDTQVAQHSIYMWTDAGEETYTDVDTELFGLPDEGIWTVRAAYAVLKTPELAASFHAGALRSLALADAALESARTGLPVAPEGRNA